MKRFRPEMSAAALALVAGFYPGSSEVLAQATSPATSSAPAPQNLEPFVVTGSYIPSTETAVEAGASPVERIDRQAIEESGATSTVELLQKVTVANANSVPVSNNALGFTPGATAISLRGLGPEATLVLINGRRVANYPVGAGGSTAFVDLNSIPLSAIQNIEVLKDGASALYGADAVAGVINIKLRRGLDGSEAFVSYGNTTDKDSSEVTASVVTGASTDKLSMLIGLNYYKKGAILNRDRAYSAVAPSLSANSSPMNLELTAFAVAAALGQSLNAPIPGVGDAAIFFAQSGADPGNNGLRPASRYTYSFDRSSTFNANEFAMSYPASERMGAFASGERKIFGTDNITAYVDLSYQNVSTEYELAPSPTGDFSTPFQVDVVIPARTANPILTVINPFFGIMLDVPAGLPIPAGWIPGPGTRIANGTAQRLAAPGAVNPFNPFNQDISDSSRGRLVEFGNRVVRGETDALMASIGLKGENIAGKWNFDGSYNFSLIRDHTRSTMTSATRFNELVNANSPIFNPASGSFVGTRTPYNPFGYYGVPIESNAALAEYARVVVRDFNQSSLGQFTGVISTRDLFALRHGGVGLAVGADFRHEQLEQEPDFLGTTGDIVGSAARAVTNAQRKIGGLFVETRVPLLPSLEASASARYEKFFTSDEDVTVPKIALRWQPIARQLTVRASYSEGFREPSLYERYSSPISVLSPIIDPRDGFVEPEQPITLEGNRRLKAEETDYFNTGVVWSPTQPRLKGVSLGVDFWAITREGTVEANPQNTVYRAFGVVPGGLLDGEALFLSSSGFISLVNSVFYNVGKTKVEGWDFSGGYQLPTDTLGRWELTTVWTLITRFDRSAAFGAALQDLLGDDATGVAADAYLKLKGRVNLNWAYRGFNVHFSGAYTDGFNDLDPAGNPYEVGDRFLIDGQASYAFRGSSRWLRDTKVTVGARNLFDWDPPQAYGGGRNTTGYPGYLYTAEGQFWYVSLGRKF
jgi:outer membrane receptor protein involved in Fe transport